jgi:hypothetical protein
MKREELSYEKRLRMMITQILLKSERELLHQKKLRAFNNIRVIGLMVIGLGLLLILGTQALAVLSTQHLRQADRLERTKEAVERLIEEKRLNIGR